MPRNLANWRIAEVRAIYQELAKRPVQAQLQSGRRSAASSSSTGMTPHLRRRGITGAKAFVPFGTQGIRSADMVYVPMLKPGPDSAIELRRPAVCGRNGIFVRRPRGA